MNFLKLNYGCGFDKRAGYLNVDSDPLCEPDTLIKDGDLSELPKLHFSELLAKDVLEHIPRAKTLDVLLDFSSLLKEKALLVVQTSSVLHIAEKLKENSSFASQYGWTICLFGNQVHAGDYHYTGFTDTTLTVYLAAAGFEIVQKELVEDWCLRYECRKKFAWDNLLLDGNLDNAEFLNKAYQNSFNRDIDETGIIHFGGMLQKGVDRREVLKQIFTAPEHLYVTASILGV